jgi:flagellar hook-basal body complex protein FliE
VPIAPLHASLPLAQPLGTQAIHGGERSPSLVEHQTVSFADVFGKAVAEANALGHAGEAAALALAEGRSDDIHGTMIATKQAGIQLELVGNVKNKVVDAFYELWRMSI